MRQEQEEEEKFETAQRNLAEEARMEKRNEWWRSRFGDLMAATLFYWIFVAFAIFIASIILTGCHQEYLPWNRMAHDTEARRQALLNPSEGTVCFDEERDRAGNCTAGDEVAGDRGRSGGADPHGNQPPSGVCDEAGCSVPASIIRAPGTVGEDWCEELRSDIENWRRVLEPDFDWDREADYVNPSRRESVVQNLRNLIRHWEAVCNDQGN